MGNNGIIITHYVPGQLADDLVCRVFKLKLDELLIDLFERNIFGEVAGYAWTIEHQKRGYHMSTYY